MDTRRRTPWIDADIKPAQPGVYERRHGSCVLFSYWTGRNWRWPSYTPLEAINAHKDAYEQGYAWRGLAEDPNKQAKRRK
jgi:hypothetical protein